MDWVIILRSKNDFDGESTDIHKSQVNDKNIYTSLTNNKSLLTLPYYTIHH